MNKLIKTLIMTSLALSLACSESKKDPSPFPAPEVTSFVPSVVLPVDLSREVYYDKLLGMLIGSAIGDAMGAPVEMWSRQAMEIQYGFIDTLIHVIREGSPEGPWEDNMIPGATTDDTRWKYLAGQYLTSQSYDSLDDKAFASFIVQLYQKEMEQVKSVETFDPEPLEQKIRHMTWLQEWAKVARPFMKNDLQGYSYALNRFYGGEMACAGMLYAPMIGGYYPGQPHKAYTESFRLGIFDIGYARDITGLTSAYVAKAMQPHVSYDSITAMTPLVDPMRYANSRLVGRLAHQSYINAKRIVFEAKSIEKEDTQLRLPKGYKWSPIEYTRIKKAYSLLDHHLQMIPFHAGEIHIINLTALLYSEGDFEKAMAFIVNYGRDNDTVAAVTGAILGAYHGYSGLPQGLAKPVLLTTRETIGIDLEALASQLTDQLFASQK
jgi:hypothetical protein